MRFGLLDLKTRIDMQDVLHLFKLLNDKVNCSELSEQIGIRAPRQGLRRRFLKSAFYALDEGYPERSFPQRELLMPFGHLDLKTCIDVQDVLYLFKLFSDKVDCSELLEQIGIRAPRQGLRVSHCFHLPSN
ncbi:hypothetical protein PV326_007532 [Microctonus aethiopoides]|nr:hypothetical protein PV326_007532 [Microctonus aethiopoides]